MARVLDKETQRTNADSKNKESCEIYAEDPQVFAVEKIVDIKATETEIQYCVKWAGYPAKYNEWVAESNVTPDLKRIFSIEKKKKEITLFEQEKAKYRLMRKRHRKMANSSALVVTSTRSGMTTSQTNYGKGKSVSMSGERAPTILECTTPEEDDNNNDGASSQSDAWEENEKECNISMPKTSSKSKVLKKRIPTKVHQEDHTVVSATRSSDCTTETTRQKPDQLSCESMTPAVKSKSGIDFSKLRPYPFAFRL